MGTIADSMDGIFSALREAALTLQQGGGIGYDFSTLRPKGALVKGVGADASGAGLLHGSVGRDVPHHHERRLAARRHDGDAVRSIIPTSRISSTPSGRQGRLSNFNLSVLVSRRLHGGGEGRCRLDAADSAARIYRTLKARALWDRIMRSTYDYAEPGVIFIDRINARKQSFLLRDHPRHQSLRRAALAALWRLPAGLDQSGQAGAATRSRMTRSWTWTNWRA